MPTKTKDKSPIKYTVDPNAGKFGFSYSSQQGANTGAALGALGGIAGGVVDNINDDPLKKGSVAMSAGSGALKGAAAGAMFGPPGAIIGGAIGAIGGFFGGRKAKKEAEAAKRAEAARREKIRIAGLQAKENAKLAQNAVGSNINLYDQNAEELSNKSGLTFLTKKLKGIKGLVPANMSAAQYKSSLQMKEISGVNTLSNY